ncbi:unnamed protein product [Sympodiomycopsis kandeliae]
MSLSQSHLGASTRSSKLTLQDLVSQSRKLTSNIDRDRDVLGSELPSINLALDQLESQSRSLAAGGGSSTSTATGAPDARAHYFLASAGIDAYTLAQNVNQTTIASAFEPLEPLQDTDVHGRLQHEQQQIILSAIDEGRRETLEDFNKSLARALHSRWSRQKKRIFEELGQHQSSSAYPDDSSAFASSTSNRPIAGRASTSRFQSIPPSASVGPASDPPLSSLSMQTKLMSYDNFIRSLNRARLKNTPYPLASEFLRQAETSSAGAPGETQTQLVECWLAMQSILGEQAGYVPREREFSSSYSNPHTYHETAQGVQLRNRIVKGSKAFLESQFETHLDNIIASNPAKAQLGGQPGMVSRVSAFLRVSLQSREGRWSPELELVRKDASATPVPVWATIFHLVRTGHSIDALRQAEEYEEGLRRSDGAFLGWFKEWIESGGRGLSRTSRDRFFAEYNSRFRNLTIAGGGSASTGDVAGVDPYKLALYRLLGRVDPTRKFPTALTRSTENWLWLQLMMTREISPDSTADIDEDQRERYTVEDLARKLRTYGEKHFDPKGRRPLHYFLVLLLSGEFERAVGFLYSRPQHQADAVHFAIALAYYGLLRCPSPQESKAAIGGEILSQGSGGSPSIDLARVITRHIRLFSSADARSALEYIYLICLNVEPAVAAETREDQREKCYGAIKDLVCQTRMYAELVGDVRVDGARVPGAIEQNLKLLGMSTEGDYLRQIVHAAATRSEAEHRSRDAILLFNLAEEYDQVISVLNRELGASLFLNDSSDADLLQGASESSKLNASRSLTATEDSTQLARAILDTYENSTHILSKINQKKRETCRLLLELKQSIRHVRNGNIERGLEIIENTNLFPISSSSENTNGGDVVTISRRAESFFRDIDESIGKNLSELLLMTMDLLYKLHNNLKSTNGTTGGGEVVAREEKVKQVKNKARSLMMFAAMLRFRIEQGVFAQITRLDAFIR